MTARPAAPTWDPQPDRPTPGGTLNPWRRRTKPRLGTVTVTLEVDTTAVEDSLAAAAEAHRATRYRARVQQERNAARQHLDSLLLEWRRELWPDPTKDPIARENSRRRLQRELAVQAYWGASLARPMYGGICGA